MLAQERFTGKCFAATKAGSAAQEMDALSAMGGLKANYGIPLFKRQTLEACSKNKYAPNW